MRGIKSFSAAITVYFFFSQTIPVTHSVTLKLTKVFCQEYDKPYAQFETCSLKALSRNKASLNLHLRLLKPPVSNVTINAELLRKGYNQEYKPFMYNTTIDFCKFVKSPNRFVFWKIVFSIINRFSNINHTCPYNHDVIAKDLILDGSMLKRIPFPAGDYMVRLKAFVYNLPKFKISSYVEVHE